MELKDYGLREGAFADIVLDAETVPEAVAARPKRKLVLKRGKPVVRDGKALFRVE
ncbi:hypothetical protein ACHMW7_23010 [Aminobacter sp. UC22_36]|uniref:hypothetical protein n=1 Tax=Aminobacter sp. UC22_36 TaxID=3374549 RepID=UPI003757457F